MYKSGSGGRPETRGGVELRHSPKKRLLIRKKTNRVVGDSLLAGGREIMLPDPVPPPPWVENARKAVARREIRRTGSTSWLTASMKGIGPGRPLNP